MGPDTMLLKYFPLVKGQNCMEYTWMFVSVISYEVYVNNIYIYMYYIQQIVALEWDGITWYDVVQIT